MWKVCEVVGNVSVFVKGLKCLVFAASVVLIENMKVWFLFCVGCFADFIDRQVSSIKYGLQ